MGQNSIDQCGRDFNPPFEHYWGGYAADPPIGSQMMPGDLYFNTTTKTLKAVDPTHEAWIPLGPPKIFDDFTNSLLDVYKWTVTAAGAGTVVIPVNEGEVDGAVRLRDTGAAVDNSAQISLGTNRCIQKARLKIFRVRLKLGSIIAGNGVRVRVVLHHDGLFGAVGDWFGFEFDAVTSANWRLKSTIAGAAVVNVNTGVVVPLNTYVELTIVITALGLAYAYIDDAYVGQISAANLTTDQLEVLCRVDDNDVAAGNNIDAIIDYIYVYQ